MIINRLCIILNLRFTQLVLEVFQSYQGRWSLMRKDAHLRTHFLRFKLITYRFCASTFRILKVICALIFWQPPTPLNYQSNFLIKKPTKVWIILMIPGCSRSLYCLTSNRGRFVLKVDFLSRIYDIYKSGNKKTLHCTFEW